MTEQDVEPKIPGVTFVVSLDELKALKIDAALNEFGSIDCFDLSRRFAQLYRERSDAQKPALRLLYSICKYQMVPDNGDEPFKPEEVGGNFRSCVLSDLCADQIEVIAQLAPAIENVGLRARLADVAWTRQRWRQGTADLAVHAYCKGIETLRDGGVSLAFENNSAWSDRAGQMAVRAARISSSTNWELCSGKRTRSLISKLVHTAATENRGIDFCRLAKVDLYYCLSSREAVAAEAERMARLEQYINDPYMRRLLLETAKYAFQLVEDDDARHRCICGIARCYKQMAEMTDVVMLKCSFLLDAIQSLRQTRGTRDERVEIEKNYAKSN